jgi:hypothetical protein
MGWSKKIECTGNGNGYFGCGAILLVEGSDLFKTTNTDITFKCPECGNLTDLPRNEILPIGMANRIPANQYKWLDAQKKKKENKNEGI